MNQNSKSRCDIFKENAEADIDTYRDTLSGDGTFDYSKQVKELEKLSNKMSLRMMQYLFGEQLGSHLFDKYRNECSRNLLVFLSRLTTEYRFFLLHELKNNPALFSYE